MTILNSFQLNGLRALVTGGSSGIGKSIAESLAQAGADIVIIGRNIDKIDASLEGLRKINKACTGIAYDLVAPETNLNDVVAQVGDVDIIVNAAGINLREPVDAISSDSWDETHRINLKVPFFLSRCFVDSMRNKGWGRVINIASLQSQLAMPNGLAYGASKGGVAQLTRAMAEAWSHYGINANAIAPGFFRTPLTSPVFEDSRTVQTLAARTAIGRNGELQDLGGVAVFLASRASDYVTGQIIYVDGGFSIK